MTTYKAKLACRKDTHTNWDTKNPTLLHGELAISMQLIDDVEVFKGIKIGENKSWKETEYIPIQNLEDIVASLMNSFADSDSIDFWYDADSKTYKFDVIPDGHNHITDVTHAELMEKVEAEELTPSNFYRITDFQTIHIIPNSVALNVNGTVYENAASWGNTLSEGVEGLILTATSVNTFAPQVFSSLFPDDIIQYKIDDLVCENNTTPRRGKITYRKDVKNSLEAYYDWRKVKFRRYKINPPAWVAATPYSKQAVVLGTDGNTYVSKKAANTGNNPASIPHAGSNPPNAEYALVNDVWWERIVLGVKSQYLGWSNTATCAMAGFIMPLNTALFEDFYTFNSVVSPTYHIQWLNAPTNTIPNPEWHIAKPLVKGDPGLMKSISIGYHTTYNNIIFADDIEGGSRINNNRFDDGCTDNLFYGVLFSNNVIGKYAKFNIFQGCFLNNTTGPNFATNYYPYNNSRHWSGTFNNLFLGNNYSANLHTAEFGNNTFLAGSYLNTNMWQTNTHRNIIQAFIYNITCGNDFSDNHIQFINSCTIGKFFRCNQCIGGPNEDKGMISSTIGDNCEGNIIRSMHTCTVGTTFKNNIIQGNFKTLTIPDGFQWNKIFGIIAPNTYFAINTQKNIFNTDFGGGTSGVPLALSNCVFNKPVTGMQVASTAVILSGVVSNVSITTKTFPTSLTNEVIGAISPDGSLWAHGTDNEGHITTEKIV